MEQEELENDATPTFNTLRYFLVLECSFDVFQLLFPFMNSSRYYLKIKTENTLKYTRAPEILFNSHMLSSTPLKIPSNAVDTTSVVDFVYLSLNLHYFFFSFFDYITHIIQLWIVKKHKEQSYLIVLCYVVA